MKSPIQNIIESRISVNNFQPDRSLDDETINLLLSLASKSPSAYNMQNWKFIVVRSKDAKNRLKKASYNQQKIVDGSVAFIICGTLMAYKDVSSNLKKSIETGIMPEKMVDEWQKQANRSHENNLGLQRDEAIRSASLVSMTLMLAAEGLGLSSCPMSGFDANLIADEFDLLPTEIPTMIIVVGHSEKNNWSQKPRKPINEVAKFY